MFLHGLRWQARTSFVYSMRHVVEIFAQILSQKGLFIDHISSCNWVIKAYPKIVCHGFSHPA